MYTFFVTFLLTRVIMQRSPSLAVGEINIFPPEKFGRSVGVLSVDGHLKSVAFLENEMTSANDGIRLAVQTKLKRRLANDRRVSAMIVLMSII